MPEPPDVSLFTRYVLENPWPPALVLLAVAAWLGYTGMREGLMRKLQAAAALGVAGAAAIAAGWLVVTSGEQAKLVTRAMVEAVVAGDTVGAMNHFSQDAAFALASPKNPGMGIDFIRNQIVFVTERYGIDSNNITMLKGFTEKSDLATVHMACFTQINGYAYLNASRWVVRVQRQADGEWKIIHLTCVDVNGNTVQMGMLR